MEIFKGIFGNKSWYKSLTGWGVVLAGTTLALHAGLTDQCTAGTLAGYACDKVLPFLTWVGGFMSVLGLRKAANPSA